MDTSNLDLQLKQLREELQQEKLKRDKLQKEVTERENGVIELQNKLVEESQDEDAATNQWRTKFDKQFKKNSYLEHELHLMKEKLEALSKIMDESPATKKNDQPDLDLRSKIKQLEHEKTVLEGKVKDCEWHLDSESKELFRLNEKKKEYMLKLNQTIQLSAPAPLLSRKKDKHLGLPDNQRILDPRKGPIKKQALVSLPKLSMSADKTYSKRYKKTKNKDGGTKGSEGSKVKVKNNCDDNTDLNNNDAEDDESIKKANSVENVDQTTDGDDKKNDNEMGTNSEVSYSNSSINDSSNDLNDSREDNSAGVAGDEKEMVKTKSSGDLEVGANDSRILDPAENNLNVSV